VAADAAMTARPCRGEIKEEIIRNNLSVAVIAAAALALCGGAAPVSHYPGNQGLTWAALAQLPDWTGAWALDPPSFQRVVATSGGPDGNPNIPPLTPQYAAMRKANGAANGGQGPAGTGVETNSLHCLPSGMPGMMSSPFSFEFLYTPGRVTIINDGREIRRVYTDGRGHNPNADPTFEGDAIGHWEGDTLVIDTQNILPDADLFVGMHTGANTHVAERISKIGPHTLEDQLVVSDPVIFAKPWRYYRTYQLNKLGMSEYVCEQNNRDSNGIVNLTPPPE